MEASCLFICNGKGGCQHEKRISLLLLLVAVLISCNSSGNGASGQHETYTYTSPLLVTFGDPFLLKAADGRFYMYGTSDGINGFRVYSSANLADWTDEGVVYEGGKEDSWALNCFWAPEVYEHNGKYYMFFSANWKHNPTNELETFRIGIAVADKPTGPFVNVSDQPLFDPGYPVIDANVYFDDENNKAYLYFLRCCYKHPVESEIAGWAKEQGWFDEIEESWVYGVELKTDFSGIIGEPQVLLRPPCKNG